jgi:hypothetical protein
MEVMTLRGKLNDEVAEMTSSERARLKTKTEALKEREERNQKAWSNLQKTVAKGNSLGELSRFHRIAENWALCAINPSALACKEKDPLPNIPGVHLVVETKKPTLSYPKTLAASERSDAHGDKKKRLL